MSTPKTIIAVVATIFALGCGTGTDNSESTGPADVENPTLKVEDTTQSDQTLADQTSVENSRSFKDLVLDQRPANIYDIVFNTGTVSARDWTKVPFNLYTDPDSTSDIIASKPAGSADVTMDGSIYCSFSDTSDATTCQSFMDSSDPRDLPIIHSLDFDNVVRLPDANQMWYHVKLGDIAGWTVTPYAYEVDGSIMSAHTHSLFSHPFILWEPVEQNLTFEDEGTLAEFNGKQVSVVMDSLNLQLSLDPEIHWNGDSPFLRVHLSPPLEWEDYCRQTKQPEPVYTGLVSMFSSEDGFSLVEVDLGWGYCD